MVFVFLGTIRKKQIIFEKKYLICHQLLEETCNEVVYDHFNIILIQISYFYHIYHGSHRTKHPY